jgi:hypothetical protein
MRREVWERIYKVEIPFCKMSDLDGVSGWVTAEGKEWFKRVGKGRRLDWFYLRITGMSENIIGWTGNLCHEGYVDGLLRLKCRELGWSSVIHSPIPYRFCDFPPNANSPFPVEDLVFPGLYEKIEQVTEAPEKDKVAPMDKGKPTGPGPKVVGYIDQGFGAVNVSLDKGYWVQCVRGDAEVGKWARKRGRRLQWVSDSGEILDRCISGYPWLKCDEDKRFLVAKPLIAAVKEVKVDKPEAPIHKASGPAAIRELLEGKWIRLVGMDRWVSYQGGRLWLMTNDGEKGQEAPASLGLSFKEFLEGEFQVTDPIKMPVKDLPEGKLFSDVVKDKQNWGKRWYTRSQGMRFELSSTRDGGLKLVLPESGMKAVPIELFTAECWYPVRCS